jgi:hypothetical protein
MPDERLTAGQFLKTESPAVRSTPTAVKVAAALLVASAVIGLINVVANWFLRGHALAFTSLTAVLLSAASVFLANKLLQLRYWALILARLLSTWYTLGFVILILTGRFTTPAATVLGLTSWGDSIFIAVLMVALFFPGVSKAFQAQNEMDAPNGNRAEGP